MADVIKEIMENVPAWQFNVIPGNANQGAILVTKNPLTNPPFKQSDFIWKPMEDIIGTADIKLEYSEEDNIFTLSKAKGHLDNENNWSYEWEIVGQWEPITEEVAEALRSLVYVSYEYDLSIPNTLKVYGIKKDMTKELMCEINFVSAQVLQQAVETLNNAIAAETTRATNREDEIAQDLSDESNRAITREDELEAMIQQATINPGAAIEVVGDNHVVNVKYDNSSIKLNGNNELYADVIDDESTGNDKTLSAQKIYSLQLAQFVYKGDLATMAELYAITGQQIGDVYYVAETGNYYIWNGTLWRDMEPDYTEGNGISIYNRVIGIRIGEGLEFHNQQIITKIGQGMMYDANYGLKVKKSNGIEVDANGVSVVPGDGIVVDNGVKVKNADNSLEVDVNGVKVKVGDGLLITSDGVVINANFNLKTIPLGTDSSKIALYSDGKIGVDFTESPVILTGELLASFEYAVGSNVLTNLSVPNMNQYDMLILDSGVRNANTNVWNSAKQDIIFTPKDTQDIYQTYLLRSSLNAAGVPQGLWVVTTILQGVNPTNNTITKLSSYGQNSWPTTTWGTNTSTEGSRQGLKIYGIKAR